MASTLATINGQVGKDTIYVDTAAANATVHGGSDDTITVVTVVIQPSSTATRVLTHRLATMMLTNCSAAAVLTPSMVAQALTS